MAASRPTGPRPSSCTSCSGPASPSSSLPRASTVPLAAAYGALFGLVRVRRLRLHELLHAAAVAIRAGAGRHGVGSGGVSRMRGSRSDRGPVKKTRDTPAQLPDPRGFQADRHRRSTRCAHGSAAIAPSRPSATTAAGCTRTPTSRGCGCCAARWNTDTASAALPGSPMRNCAISPPAGASAVSEVDPTRRTPIDTARAHRRAAEIRCHGHRPADQPARVGPAAARTAPGRVDAGAGAGRRRLAPRAGPHRA